MVPVPKGWQAETMDRISRTDVDETAIQRELEARRFGLAFPPALEALFETETGRERSRRLAVQGLVGLGIYLLYLWADHLLTPDILPLAVAIRLGLVTPLSLVALALLRRNPQPRLREGSIAVVSVLGGFSTLFIMVMRQSPLRDAEMAALVLVVLFVTLVQRLRFPYAAASCGVLLAGYVAAALALPGLAPERAMNAIFLFSAAVGLALIGAWTLEHEFRRAYLLLLKQRLAIATLSELSLHDPMTALENRRALDVVLSAMVAEAPEQQSLAAVLLDIDRFKAFNDSLGHVAGDQALRRIAGVLRRSLRDNHDRAFRFGGEEFLLILPRTDLGGAVMLAERLRRAIEAEGIVHPAVPGGVLTASLGVAAMRLSDGEVVGRLIEAADAALYEAKRAGRNRVHPPLLSEPAAVSSLAS